MASHPDTADQPDTPRNRGDDDAPHLSPATPAEDQRTILLNEIAWGAVLAGVVVALVTQLLLNMLGLGIGIATLDPGTGDNPSATSLSIGAGIWWTLSGILASLVGGYAAGRLSGRPKEATAAWHGLTAWAFTTLVIFYLLSSTVGGVLGGVYNTVSGALGGLGRGRGGHRRCGGTGPVAGGRPDGGDRDLGARRQRRQRSGGLARCRGHGHARGPHRRPGPGAGCARTGRAGARQGAEHPDRAGPHAGRRLRAAVPPDRGAGTPAGDGRRPTRRPGWSRAGRCSASSPWRWVPWRPGSAAARARSTRP